MTDRMCVERITSNNRTLALILRRSFEEKGISFLTDPQDAFQLGVLKHQGGAHIQPHAHRASIRTVTSVQEMLYVCYGRVRADFYDDDGEEAGSAILEEGDSLLIMCGGHGFKVLEDCKMIEVKQGPYYGREQDKELLQGR